MAEYIDREQLLELINENCKYKNPTRYGSIIVQVGSKEQIQSAVCGNQRRKAVPYDRIQEKTV